MSAAIIKENKRNFSLLKKIILLLIVIGLAVAPLFIAKNAEFSGADEKAEAAITEIKSNYEPWFSPIFEPKSGEIESLLFALQAAIGSGILFYCLGYMKGKRKREETEKNDIH